MTTEALSDRAALVAIVKAWDSRHGDPFAVRNAVVAARQLLARPVDARDLDYYRMALDEANDLAGEQHAIGRWLVAESRWERGAAEDEADSLRDEVGRLRDRLEAAGIA